MIGSIQIMYQGKATENQWGEPIESESTWSDKITCRYKANTNDNKGRYDDGKFTRTAFDITVPNMDIERGSIIKLYDDLDELLCEKQIQSFERLRMVQRIKITV